MKILQIITLSDLGGAQSVVIELSNAFVKEGHEVLVMSQPNGPMWNLLDNAVKKIPCNFFWRDISLLNDLKAYFFIKKTIKQLKPDVIHLHSSKIGALGRLATYPLFTKKVVYTIHGFDSVLIAYKKFLPVEKMLKNLCGKIVAVSNYEYENIIKYKIKNTVAIYNAVSDKNNTSLLDPKIVNSITAIQKNRKIIMCVARDARPKRIDLFRELAEKMTQHCFIWIGNRDEIENKPENLYCLGEINNAGVYFSLADISVLFTDHEAFGLVIIEAFSCSIPVLASNVGGIPELLDESCGYALPNETDQFAKKIEEIFSDAKQYEYMKKSARKKYEDFFTIEKMVKSYANTYNSLR